MNNILTDDDSWLAINTNEEWKIVDSLIKGGHDGVLKDLHWSHREFVDTDLNMVFEGKPNVWLLIQMQNKPVSSVEFLLIGVEEFSLRFQDELVVSAEIHPDFVRLSLSEGKGSRIEADRILYRILTPPLLGNNGFDCLKIINSSRHTISNA